MMSGGGLCLLCSSPEVIPLTSNAPERNFDPSGQAHVGVVEMGSQVIFLLRQLLHLPTPQVTDLLSHHGHPATWIDLCAPCSTLVDQGRDLYLQINRLQSEFQNLQVTLRNQLTLKKELYDPISGSGHGGQSTASDKIRGFISASATIEVSHPFVIVEDSNVENDTLSTGPRNNKTKNQPPKKGVKNREETLLQSDQLQSPKRRGRPRNEEVNTFINLEPQDVKPEDIEDLEIETYSTVPPDHLGEGNNGMMGEEIQPETLSLSIPQPHPLFEEEEETEIEIPDPHSDQDQDPFESSNSSGPEYFEVEEVGAEDNICISERRTTRNVASGRNFMEEDSDNSSDIEEVIVESDNDEYEPLTKRVRNGRPEILRDPLQQRKQVGKTSKVSNKTKTNADIVLRRVVDESKKLINGSGKPEQAVAGTTLILITKAPAPTTVPGVTESDYDLKIPATPSWVWTDFVKWRESRLLALGRDEVNRIPAGSRGNTLSGSSIVPTLEWLANKYKIDKFPCSGCDKVFTDYYVYERHRPQRCVGAGPYQCWYQGCELSYAHPSSLEIHFRSKHLPDGDITCGGCGVICVQIQDFNDHIKNECQPGHEVVPGGPVCIEKGITCSTCLEIGRLNYFSSQSVLDIHIRTRHPPFNALPFACTVSGCGKRFILASTLKSHNKSYHPTDSEGEGVNSTCDQCGKTFKDPERLACHIRKVHVTRLPGAKRFPCDICGKEMVDKGKLNRHKQIHIRPEDAPHLCTICGKRFRLGEYLNVHIQSHDPERHLKYAHYKPRTKKAPGEPEKFGVAGAKIGRPPVKKPDPSSNATTTTAPKKPRAKRNKNVTIPSEDEESPGTSCSSNSASNLMEEIDEVFN